MDDTIAEKCWLDTGVTTWADSSPFTVVAAVFVFVAKVSAMRISIAFFPLWLASINTHLVNAAKSFLFNYLRTIIASLSSFIRCIFTIIFCIAFSPVCDAALAVVAESDSLVQRVVAIVTEQSILVPAVVAVRLSIAVQPAV